MTDAHAPVMRLGDVAEVKAGFGFPEYLQGKTTGSYPFYKVGDISEAWKAKQVGLVAAHHYVDDADLPTLKARPLPAGAIVFAKIGAAIGLNRRCVLTKPALVDNNVFGLVPKHGVANTKYLFQFMCSVDLMPLARATTVPSLRKGDVEELRLPMPSLARQQQIADYLDEQLSRLDASVAALHRVQANLKRYRASVLKSACEGRLVPTEAELAHHEGRIFETGEQLLQRIVADREARIPARGRVKQSVPIESSLLPSSPEGWAWASVDQLSAPEPNSITDGPFGSNLKSEHYTESGPRVIRLQNIKDGEFADEYAHIAEERFIRLAKHQVFPGDLVIATLGEAPPRACLIPAKLGSAIVKADCVRFKPHPDMLPTFANLVLNAEPTRKRVKGLLHGVGRPRLSLGELRAVAIPLPPLAEQLRIVAEADRRLSLIRVAEAQVATNLARAQRLRQSILQAAFAG